MEIGKKERIAWIDMAKGYGTILVILAHMDQNSLTGAWIYTFHMPLFFFLSGYVFSAKGEWGSFLKKKVKSILLPYFALGLPMVIFEVCRMGKSGERAELFLKTFVDLLVQKRLWTLWFLAVLFGVNILFYLILKFTKNHRQTGIVVVLLTLMGLLYYRMGGGPVPWNIDTCFTALPFFAAGYACKSVSENKPKATHAKKWMLPVLLLVNIVAGGANLVIAGTGLEMFYCRYGVEPLTYLSAFAGVFVIVLLAKKTTFLPIQYIGKHSLVYYAWHQTIAMPLVENMLGAIGFSRNWYAPFAERNLYNIISVLLVILMMTLCNEIIMRTRMRRLIGR